MSRTLIATLVTSLALGVPSAVASQPDHHVRRHFKHHPECHSLACAHHADALYNRKLRKERERREAREAAEGWAIPEYIVICESKGVNLPPNSAGASGYYQIIPGTWSSHGGLKYASEAYLATKAQQGIIARKIWNEGGPSEWVCS